jgi:hypothetical protein
MHAMKNRMAIGDIAIRVMVCTVVAVALLLSTGSAWAQTTDVMKVTYFDNNGTPGAPAAEIHVLNPGAGALCADIYVWRADQELTECCACPISVNGLLTFTVAQATANPGDGTATPPVSGSIDIVADSAAACNASAPTPTPTLRAWATHVNTDSIGPTTENAFDVTETAFLDASLSTGEQSEASVRCGLLQLNGSGTGVCSAICTATTDTVRKVVKK